MTMEAGKRTVTRYRFYQNREKIVLCWRIVLKNFKTLYRSWDSSVGVVTRLWPGQSGFNSQQDLGSFLFATPSRPALGLTQPPIQWVLGVLSPGVKQPGHKDDCSPPSSTKVKNMWSYTSTPQYVFMARYLIKHRDNFTFNLPLKSCTVFLYPRSSCS
jgi:hypothetical protein